LVGPVAGDDLYLDLAIDDIKFEFDPSFGKLTEFEDIGPIFKGMGAGLGE